MDFEKVCMLFTMREPFYGILLSSMQRVPVSPRKMNTIGVTRTGNVFQILYNPDFVNKLSVEALIQVLKHEVIHVAFNHFSIWDDPDGYIPPPDIQKLRNIAADLEVNCYIDQDILLKELSNGTFVQKFGFEPRLGTREYYRMLKQELDKQRATAQKPTKPCNGGQGGDDEDEEEQEGGSGNTSNNGKKPSKPQNDSDEEDGEDEMNSGQGEDGEEQNDQPSMGNDDLQQQGQSGEGSASPRDPVQDYLDSLEQFDDHSEWPDDMTQEEIDELSQAIDDMVLFAADEVEKNCGTVPGELAGRVTMLRKKPKPVADWKRYMRRYLGNEFTDLIRKSKKRESLRFPDAAGNRHKRKSHILVAIDTSGSVSMPEYQEFFGQIRTLTQHASFHVIECDSRIQYEYDFKLKPNDVLHGGGGTSFQPPIDYFNKNRRAFDALIYFTDGEAPIPKDTPKETLWVVSSKGDHDREKYKVNGASVAIIPQNK